MSDGWFLEKRSGSHRQYRHGATSGYVTIAFHGGTILAPKTLKSILDQAGLSVDEFIVLLQEARMRRHTVLLFHEDGIYSALVPVLNLATQGDTVEHALAMAREAIQLRLTSLLEDGEFVPEEGSAPIVAAVDVELSVEAVA